MTKLLDKHNVDILRTTLKYKYTHIVFVKTFNKELTKYLFRYMDAHKLQHLEKVSAIYVKNLNGIVSKIKNTTFFGL